MRQIASINGRKKHTITARIKGGLGNQLFAYAAAKRLAISNNAILKIDHISGYLDDSFGRQYALDNYNIESLKVSPNELIVSNRYYRGALKLLSSMMPLKNRYVIYESTGRLRREHS